MELTKQQQAYVSDVIKHAPALSIDTNKVNYSRAELRQVSMATKGNKWIPNWITHDVSRRVDRGIFSVPEIHEQYLATGGSYTKPEDDTTVSEDDTTVDASTVTVNDDMVIIAN